MPTGERLLAERVSRRRLVGGAGIAGLGLLAACGRLPLQAAPPPTVYRIGWLSGSSATGPSAQTQLAAFNDGLKALGYVEGENLITEFRWGEGSNAGMEEFAAELVRLGAEVFAVPSAVVAQAAQRATRTIPIVAAGANDLIAAGLSTNLARPDANVTGLTEPLSLIGKNLEMLKETVPGIVRVAALHDVTGGFPREEYQNAAQRAGLQLQVLDVRGGSDLAGAFDAATRAQAEALTIRTGPLINSLAVQVIALAAQHRLPSMWTRSDFVTAGALMAYGPNFAASYRRAAAYVDKLLKGAKPADLPIEQPTTFDFVINLQTAQSLGLTIPPDVAAQVTEWVQ
jgi:putative ABC transport system substrate-binding protein